MITNNRKKNIWTEIVTTIYIIKIMWTNHYHLQNIYTHKHTHQRFIFNIGKTSSSSSMVELFKLIIYWQIDNQKINNKRNKFESEKFFFCCWINSTLFGLIEEHWKKRSTILSSLTGQPMHTDTHTETLVINKHLAYCPYYGNDIWWCLYNGVREIFIFFT